MRQIKIVYVTGCLGFIGAYITRNCLARGWMVYGIDKVSYASNPRLLEEFRQYPNFHFERADICQLVHLYDCDYVINCAAESHVGNSIVNSDKFVNSNIVGVKNLLDLIRSKQINCNERPMLFHLSTDEVYGDVKKGVHKETSVLKPSNPYSAAKAAADMLIHAWGRTYGIEYIILRPTNNYGIGQYPEKLIPLSVKNLRRGKKIRLHDQGKPSRNWLHVEDTAEAVMAILDADVRNEIFNVSGGFEQTNIDTVKKVISAFHSPDEDWTNHVDLSYDREGQDVRYAIDDSKLRKLGWEPEKDFNEEIYDIVTHHKENFRW